MVAFQDNTARDGMQQRNINKNFSTKLKAFELIAQSNVDSVEIGMCASYEDYLMICKEAEKLNSEQEIDVLTRMVKQDIDIAARLMDKIPNLVIKLLVPISDLHIEKKLGLTQESMRQKLVYYLTYLKSLGVKINICFEDATRADRTYFINILKLCNKYSIQMITIADTVGCMVPEEYGSFIHEIKSYKFNFGISVHCHNDLGLATANSVAGVLNGADQVETTFLGIGERAGNAPTEEVSYILLKKYNIKSNMTLRNIYETSRKMSQIVKFPIAATKPIVGENAFIHESGIHQDGMLKDRHMYQFVLPEEFGIKANPLDENISGISSSKLIQKAVLKKFKSNINDNRENLVDFYRIIAKVVDHITIEEAYELYELFHLLQSYEPEKNHLYRECIK